MTVSVKNEIPDGGWAHYYRDYQGKLARDYLIPILSGWGVDLGSSSVLEVGCGDGGCANGETVCSCPSDCACAACDGDGLCETGEDVTSCPSDCASAACDGDGMCETGETATSCPSDCASAACNGNSLCETGEDACSCLSDCACTG